MSQQAARYPHLPHHSLASLVRYPTKGGGQVGGPRGEGSFAAGSPLGYTAKLDFW